MTEETKVTAEAAAKAERRKKLIGKIKIMQALVDHPATPEGERMAALATIRRLSDQFAISSTDIEHERELEIVDHLIDFSAPLHPDRVYVILTFGKAVDFCNCKLLTLSRIDDPTGAVQGLRLIGTRMDVDVARAAITFLMDQTQNLLRSFYKDVKAAYTVYATAYEERWRAADWYGADDFDPKRRQRIVDSRRPAEDEETAATQLQRILGQISTGTEVSWTLDFGARGSDYRDVVRKIARRLFVAEPQMPRLNDSAWTTVESDWGLGFAHRIGERLDTELKNTDDEEPEDDWDSLLPHVPGDHEFNTTVENLPVAATGTALTLIGDQVRDDKFRRINDFLKKDEVGVFKVDADLLSGDLEITNLGREKANAIDLSSLHGAGRKAEKK